MLSIVVGVPVLALFAPVVYAGFWLFQRDFRPDDEPLLGALLIFVVIWLTVVGFLAPLLALGIAAYFVLGKPAGGLIEGFAAVGSDGSVHFSVASAGLAVALFWIGRDAIWRFRQASQVENLPTSKARSVATGLVELRGVAQNAGSEHGPILRLSWDMFSYLQPKQELRPFYLHDTTGRVLVDPTECRARAGWVTDIVSVFGSREIVLKRRVEKNDDDDSVVRILMPGDPVYLIGNAEINPKAPPDAVDSERLVIRPASQSSWSLPLWRFLFGKAEPAKGRSIFNVFFLADKDEVSARRLILNGMHTVWAIGFLWLASSSVLLWFAQHPLSPPPDSWRKAYWVGGHADSERYSRFEKYLKTQGAIPDHEAISALLEALNDDDVRFRVRAASALIRFLPRDRDRVKEAVPALIQTLHLTRQVDRVQSTINALAEFGPYAKPAVPTLIEFLRHEDFIVRYLTARALGRLGPTAHEAIPALTARALEDRNTSVRNAAADALRRVR